MEIIIIIKEKDKVIAKRTALTFEGAEEDLGKLQRYWKDLEKAKAEDNQAEENNN